MSEFLFTVFTPAYNRAEFLERVWESLEHQSFKGFEWIIVDDGSTDSTQEKIADIRSRSTIPIRSFQQQNRGKHAAINVGVKHAQGYFFAILDSDDQYTQDALKLFAEAYEKLSPSLKPNILGVAALLEDETGTIIGEKFPEDYWISDNISVKYVHGIEGDKISAVKTSIMKEYPFPENLGKFCPESIVWNRMAYRYQGIYINEVVATAEYQTGGLTDNALQTQVRNPYGTLVVCSELLSGNRKLPLVARLKLSVNFSRFCLHSESFWKYWVLKRGTIISILIMFPLALAKWLQDKYKLKEPPQRS